MRVVVAAANNSGRNRDLKIHDVALVTTNTVGDLLNELLRIPRLPAPLGQQVVGEHTSAVLITGLQLGCLLEKRALSSRVPILILGYRLHSEVPLRALGGKGRGLVKNSLGFGSAFFE